MTRICPKCNYVRKETDDVPDWQCPSCQVAYNKVGGEPVAANYGRYGAPVVSDKRSDSGVAKWIIAAVLVGAGFWVSKPLWHGAKKPVTVAVASAQPPVTLYSAEWCGYCTATREFFDANGIQYTELDVEKNSAGYEGHKKLGGQGVPLIVIGDDVIHGYNAGHIQSLLQPWLKPR